MRSVCVEFIIPLLFCEFSLYSRNCPCWTQLKAERSNWLCVYQVFLSRRYRIFISPFIFGSYRESLKDQLIAIEGLVTTALNSDFYSLKQNKTSPRLDLTLKSALTVNFFL